MSYDGNKDHYHGRDLLNLLLKYNVGFAEGNIMKYVFRWKDKEGINDLLKAKDYLDTLIERNQLAKQAGLNTLPGQWVPVTEKQYKDLINGCIEVSRVDNHYSNLSGSW